MFACELSLCSISVHTPGSKRNLRDINVKLDKRIKMGSIGWED